MGRKCESGPRRHRAFEEVWLKKARGDSWREAWDQREVLSNFYEEVFCELRRLKKFKEEGRPQVESWGLFLGASRKEGWSRGGYMHKCGGTGGQEGKEELY